MLENLQNIIDELHKHVPGLDVSIEDTKRIVTTPAGNMPEIKYEIKIEGQYPIQSKMASPLLVAQIEIAQNIWRRLSKSTDQELLSILAKLGWTPPKSS